MNENHVATNLLLPISVVLIYLILDSLHTVVSAEYYELPTPNGGKWISCSEIAKWYQDKLVFVLDYKQKFKSHVVSYTISEKIMAVLGISTWWDIVKIALFGGWSPQLSKGLAYQYNEMQGGSNKVIDIDAAWRGQNGSLFDGAEMSAFVKKPPWKRVDMFAFKTLMLIVCCIAYLLFGTFLGFIAYTENSLSFVVKGALGIVLFTGSVKVCGRFLYHWIWRVNVYVKTRNLVRVIAEFFKLLVKTILSSVTIDKNGNFKSPFDRSIAEHIEIISSFANNLDATTGEEGNTADTPVVMERFLKTTVSIIQRFKVFLLSGPSMLEEQKVSIGGLMKKARDIPSMQKVFDDFTSLHQKNIDVLTNDASILQQRFELAVDDDKPMPASLKVAAVLMPPQLQKIALQVYQILDAMAQQTRENAYKKVMASHFNGNWKDTQGLTYAYDFKNNALLSLCKLICIERAGTMLVVYAVVLLLTQSWSLKAAASSLKIEFGDENDPGTLYSGSTYSGCVSLGLVYVIVYCVIAYIVVFGILSYIVRRLMYTFIDSKFNDFKGADAIMTELNGDVSAFPYAWVYGFLETLDFTHSWKSILNKEGALDAVGLGKHVNNVIGYVKGKISRDFRAIKYLIGVIIAVSLTSYIVTSAYMYIKQNRKDDKAMNMESAIDIHSMTMVVSTIVFGGIGVCLYMRKV